MQFPPYKIIYNNTLDALTCIRHLCIQYTPARGGLITMIHKSIIFSCNITKITSPIEPTLYLRTSAITNKALIPIVLINLYMPTHEENIHTNSYTQQKIKQILTTHWKHFPFLIGDFNQDIILIGHHIQHSLTQPTNEDIEWEIFTLDLQFTPIKGDPTITTLAS